MSSEVTEQQVWEWMQAQRKRLELHSIHFNVFNGWISIYAHTEYAVTTDPRSIADVERWIRNNDPKEQARKRLAALKEEQAQIEAELESGVEG